MGSVDCVQCAASVQPARSDCHAVVALSERVAVLKIVVVCSNPLAPAQAPGPGPWPYRCISSGPGPWPYRWVPRCIARVGSRRTARNSACELLRTHHDQTMICVDDPAPRSCVSRYPHPEPGRYSPQPSGGFALEHSRPAYSSPAFFHLGSNWAQKRAACERAHERGLML